jgi:hypothetical protein
MSYTGSQAQSGNQAVVSINTGTASTPVWTVVGEINDFNQSGTMNKTDDTTNLQSTAEEFLPTILTPGKFSGTMNRISGDAGQVAVKTAFTSAPPTLNQWKVQLAKNANKVPPQTTAGDSIVFTGMVEEFTNFGTVKPDKKVNTSFSVKVSGPIVETLGS